MSVKPANWYVVRVSKRAHEGYELPRQFRITGELLWPKRRARSPRRRRHPESAKTQAVRPVKGALTKSALIDLVASENDIPRGTAKGVLESLENALLGSVHPRGVGEFTWPGLMKVTLRKVPARKAGTLVRNPATGEMTPGAAKPASVRVKVRALSKLKAAATS